LSEEFGKNYKLIDMSDILDIGQSLRLNNAQCSGEQICLDLQVERGRNMVGSLKRTSL
jgi:hypothetical protein